MKITPKKIRRLREKLKLTQKEFGRLLGISWQHLSALENNKKKITKRTTISINIIETLNLDASTAKHYYKISFLNK